MPEKTTGAVETVLQRFFVSEKKLTLDVVGEGHYTVSSPNESTPLCHGCRKHPARKSTIAELRVLRDETGPFLKITACGESRRYRTYEWAEDLLAPLSGSVYAVTLETDTEHRFGLCAHCLSQID